MAESLFNTVARPNFAKFLRKILLQNIFGRLLLDLKAIIEAIILMRSILT